MRKLSIIIPTLNEGKHIQKTLHRLQGFRQRGHEVILVDGGSQDATRAIASNLCDVCVQASKGRAIQMNTGAKLASGEILLFLHADTVLPDDADAAIDKLGKNVSDFWGWFTISFDSQHWMFPIIAFFMAWRSRITGIATGDQSIFVSRKLFQSIGMYPEQALMEDIELSKRLRRRLQPCCLLPKVITSSRRWQKHGIFRTILLMWFLRLAYFCGVDASRLAARYSKKQG